MSMNVGPIGSVRVSAGTHCCGGSAPAPVDPVERATAASADRVITSGERSELRTWYSDGQIDTLTRSVAGTHIDAQGVLALHDAGFSASAIDVIHEGMHDAQPGTEHMPIGSTAPASASNQAAADAVADHVLTAAEQTMLHASYGFSAQQLTALAGAVSGEHFRATDVLSLADAGWAVGQINLLHEALHREMTADATSMPDGMDPNMHM